METCRIDGQIEEIRRLLDKTSEERYSLEKRLNELLEEKRKMLEEEPLKVIRKALGDAKGINYSMNGHFSPQIEFYEKSVGKVYNYSKDPIIPFLIRGIEIDNGKIRLCFDSRVKL